MSALSSQKVYLKNADGFIEITTFNDPGCPHPFYNIEFVSNASSDTPTRILVRVFGREVKALGNIIDAALKIGT